MKWRLPILLCLLGGALLSQQRALGPRTFTPPDQGARTAAIGPTDSLTSLETKVFAESGAFRPKSAPNPSDWLGAHREPGQTFSQYLRARRNRLEAPRTILYVQPVGAFPEAEQEVLEQVAVYAGIFFQAEVKIQKPADAVAAGITTRIHHGQEQLLSTDVLDFLKADLPADAYARIAVTMTDLYPEPSWNFVFGQASLQDRVGVYSFARYGETGDPQFLRRCLRVFSHETGHMFAVRHCIHYQCLMNGSNHLAESDATPLFLCPVCLRKLHAANPLKIVGRYERMLGFFKEVGLATEAAWTEQRIKALR